MTLLNKNRVRAVQEAATVELTAVTVLDIQAAASPEGKATVSSSFSAVGRHSKEADRPK